MSERDYHDAVREAGAEAIEQGQRILDDIRNGRSVATDGQSSTGRKSGTITEARASWLDGGLEALELAREDAKLLAEGFRPVEGYLLEPDDDQGTRNGTADAPIERPADDRSQQGMDLGAHAIAAASPAVVMAKAIRRAPELFPDNKAAQAKFVQQVGERLGVEMTAPKRRGEPEYDR